MTSLCTEFWQALLCQGVGLGVSMGFTYLPAVGSFLLLCQLACSLAKKMLLQISVLAHYFRKRRSTVMGIGICGSSIGGTLTPISNPSEGYVLKEYQNSGIVFPSQQLIRHSYLPWLSILTLVATVLLNSTFRKIGFASGVRACILISLSISPKRALLMLLSVSCIFSTGNPSHCQPDSEAPPAEEDHGI